MIDHKSFLGKPGVEFRSRLQEWSAPGETAEAFRERLQGWLASGEAERAFQAYREDRERPVTYMIFSEWLASVLAPSL